MEKIEGLMERSNVRGMFNGEVGNCQGSCLSVFSDVIYMQYFRHLRGSSLSGLVVATSVNSGLTTRLNLIFKVAAVIQVIKFVK